jgi:hypothetical protein
MQYPTFNGVPMFGSAWKMQACVINPMAVQSNDFPGLNGTEELNQGLRGAFTMVSGVLTGETAEGLNAYENLFRSYYDGRAYVLVDQFDNYWPNVKLEVFQPEDRIVRYADGSFGRRYTARFRHISIR